MKNGAAAFVKQILCLLRSIAKAKSTAIKSKTDAIRARLIVFSLLRNKKLSLGAVSNKIHALLGQQQQGHEERSTADDQDKAIMPYNATTADGDQVSLSLLGHNHDEVTDTDLGTCSAYHYHNEVEDDKYPDLTHSLFEDIEDDELDLGGPNSSVIDLPCFPSLIFKVALRTRRGDGMDYIRIEPDEALPRHAIRKPGISAERGGDI